MHRDISKMTRRELAAYVASLNTELAAINETRRAKAALKAAAENVISEMDRRAVEPSVSDHALVRFVERAKGFDIEAVRDQMLTPAVADAINSGATAVTVNGLKFRVREKVITTVID